MDWEKGCSWGEKAPLHAHLPEKGGTLNLTFQAGGVQSLSCYRWCGCMKTPPPGLGSLLPDLPFMGLPVALAAAPGSHSLSPGKYGAEPQ